LSVKPGDVIELGRHRLYCGDTTDGDAVRRLVGDDVVTLIHADPPYGMGKEKDGVANDNLYREKLDAFQMQWWNAWRPSVADNGSAYIWGNAPELWRLWYCGGLADSERLTMRNEVVWDKQCEGNTTLRVCGATFEQDRSFTQSERCLFFMLGEQGFNNNADNYWNRWDSVRLYLKQERDLLGWSIQDCKRIAGHSPTSGCHWFDRSQWMMPTAETYKSWQAAAKGDAFRRDHDELKREHDELKREFYETRAHFNNTHDNMTDVWSFPRVTGAARWGHATPKPVVMAERAILSSSKEGDCVGVPFAGTAPELIACERTDRTFVGAELSQTYCERIIERWNKETAANLFGVVG